MRLNSILQVCLAGFALGEAATADASPGRKDALQIDWEIPQGAFAPEKLQAEKRGVSFTFNLVPAHLLVTDQVVTTVDGQAVLPSGAQLYRMVGPKLLACSQDQFPAGQLGTGNRVCVLDEDGDGRFDSYFLRSMGRSFLAGDMMWFAMNDNMPSPAGRLQPFTASDGNPLDAHQRAKIIWTLIPQSAGGVSIDLDIEDHHHFRSYCGDRKGGNTATEFRGPCGSPSIEVHAWNLDKPAPERMIEVKAPDRRLKVRFDVEPRLMGARLMSGMIVE